MKRIHFITIFALSALVSACVSVIGASDYDYSERATSSGFEVSFTNLSRKPICFVFGVWPNSDGYTGDVEGIPQIRVGDQVHRYANRFSAIGHMNRPLVVEAGETVSIKLVPGDFENAPENVQGVLEFDPIPFYCRKIEN